MKRMEKDILKKSDYPQLHQVCEPELLKSQKIFTLITVQRKSNQKWTADN
ncbi:MAG: hypothetical protein AAFO99_02550 [Bacteroidota bacterium]